MNRTEKEAFVANLKENLQDKSIAIVTRQTGLTVSEVTELRQKVREAEASYKVVKNTLARLAVTGTDFEALKDHLSGTTSISYASEPVGVAKALADFAKSNDKLEIVGGVLDGKGVDKSTIEALAKLPSLDALRGKLVGLLQAPAGKLARLAKEPGAQLARVINAYAQNG